MTELSDQVADLNNKGAEKTKLAKELDVLNNALAIKLSIIGQNFDGTDKMYLNTVNELTRKVKVIKKKLGLV